MGNLSLLIDMTDIASDFEQIHLLDGRSAAQRLSNLLTGFACGAIKGSVQMESGTSLAKASGTFTLDTVIATDAVSINGVTFTCVASGATGNQFNVGASDTLTAVAMAAAINASASALVNQHVSASAAGTIVTITAKEFGDEGNAITIASADATIVASGARLTGGSDGTVTTYTFG